MIFADKINGWHPVILSVIALGIGMMDVNEILKAIIYLITIGYISWKWFSEYQKSKKKK